MIRSQTSFLLLTALVTGMLGACSHPQNDAQTPAAHETPKYAAVARGRIDIEAGLLPLDASVSGVVAHVKVHTGDRVKRGEVLAILHTDQAQAAVTVARGTLQQAQAQARLIAAKRKAARHQAGLLAKAAAAGADSGQHAAAAAEHVTELDAQAASAQAAVTVAQGHLQQAERVLQLHTIRAPRDAQIVDVATQPGQTVSPQSGPLFHLLPDAPRIVVAELDSTFADRVHAGMQAEIVLDDDSAQSLGRAHVIEVGQVYETARLDGDSPQRGHARTVRCLLRFDHAVARRIGQRVLVRFLKGSGPSTHG